MFMTCYHGKRVFECLTLGHVRLFWFVCTCLYVKGDVNSQIQWWHPRRWHQSNHGDPRYPTGFQPERLSQQHMTPKVLPPCCDPQASMLSFTLSLLSIYYVFFSVFLLAFPFWILIIQFVASQCHTVYVEGHLSLGCLKVIFIFYSFVFISNRKA